MNGTVFTEYYTDITHASHFTSLLEGERESFAANNYYLMCLQSASMPEDRENKMGLQCVCSLWGIKAPHFIIAVDLKGRFLVKHNV